MDKDKRPVLALKTVNPSYCFNTFIYSPRLLTNSLNFCNFLVVNHQPIKKQNHRRIAMKLGDDEQIVAKYYFKGTEDVSNMSILTNKRLVVIYRNAEESYPLSKITAVKVIYNRIVWEMVIGAFLALLGLLMIGSNAVAGLVCLAIGAVLFYLGLKGKTRLLIKHMGGDKYYAVTGKDKALQDFIEAVNSKLS
jgi:hypothetical protein